MILHPSLKSLAEHADSGAPDTNIRLERHLANCGKCRARVNALRNLEPALEPEKDISDGFTERLLEKLPEVITDNRPVLGELKTVLGNMLIFKGDDKDGSECFPNMLLRAGDYLKLDKNSKALIQLNDGSGIYINKDTELSLETANRYNLKMHSGEIFAMMKPQSERFRIKTPSAELSVIGTEFSAGITGDNETVLKVKKGRVAFKNSSGETVAGRKQQIKASPDRKPAASRLENDKSISNWTGSINTNGKGGNKNTMPKKIIGLILTLAIVIAGYMIYKQLSKVAPDHETAESASYDPENWQENFHKLYRLEEGQVLRRIAPPFIPERQVYYENELRTIDKRYPENPGVLYFGWKEINKADPVPAAADGSPVYNYGRLVNAGSHFNEAIELNGILRNLFELKWYEFDEDDGFLKTVIVGDWIVRSGSPVEERMAELSWILRNDLNMPVKITKRTVNREVIIAEGTYTHIPLPDYNDKDNVHIYVDAPDTDPGGGISSGDFLSFLDTIGSLLKIRIINNTGSAATQVIGWIYHQDIRWDGLKEPGNTDKVLANISAQTGLRFRKETRPAEVWFFERDEEFQVKQLSFKVGIIECDSQGLDYLESVFPGFRMDMESIGIKVIDSKNDNSITKTVTETMKAEGLAELAGATTMITVSNGPAEINMQREIPTGNMNNLTMEGIGLKLKFTPQIEDDNYITLEINSEYSYLEDSIVPGVPKKVSRRETNSTMKIMEGQLLAIRCMRDKKNDKYAIVLLHPDIIE